jgi:hypothetical protein
MKKVYFEIFGKKLVVTIEDKKHDLFTDAQIEYYIRGQLKINKIEDVTPPNQMDDIFGMFNEIFGRGFKG